MDNEPVRKERDNNWDMPELSKERISGNIWGWRNSAIGGVIMLIIFILVTIRYCQVKPEKMYIRESQVIENQNNNENKLF